MHRGIVGYLPEQVSQGGRQERWGGKGVKLGGEMGGTRMGRLAGEGGSGSDGVCRILSPPWAATPFSP